MDMTNESSEAPPLSLKRDMIPLLTHYHHPLLYSTLLSLARVSC